MFCNADYYDEELINLLFEQGVDINNKLGVEDIYLSFIEFAPENIAIKLLEKVTNVNEKLVCEIWHHPDSASDLKEPTMVYDSYLNLAIQKNKPQLALALIKSGAVNFKSPLLVSVMYSSMQINDKLALFELLIEKGLDVNGGASSWEKPLMQVIDSSMQSTDKLAILELLIEKGLDINCGATNYYENPLMQVLCNSLMQINDKIALWKFLIAKEKEDDLNVINNANGNIMWQQLSSAATWNKDKVNDYNELAKLLLTSGKLKLSEEEKSSDYYKYIEKMIKIESDITWLSSREVINLNYG